MEGEGISTACNEIRNQVRRTTHSERLAHREATLKHNRRSLDDVVEELISQTELSADVVSKHAQKLVQQSKKISHLDLRKLKEALIFDKNNIKVFVKFPNALQALSGQLIGSKALHQLEAAYACCNLALGDEHTCLKLSRSAGVYLIQYLNGQNVLLQIACAWTLGNLAGSSSKVLNVLHSQGLISALIAQCQNSNADVIDAALYALCHAVQIGGLPEDDILSIARETVNLISHHPDSHWLLFLLSGLPCCDNILLDHSIPLFCVKFLSENPASPSADLKILRSVTSLLRTIANMCSETSGKAASVVLNCSELNQAINNILQSTYQHLHKELFWLQENLLQHPNQDISTKAQALSLNRNILSENYAEMSNY